MAGSMSGALKLWDLEQAKSKLSIIVVSCSVITCAAVFMTLQTLRCEVAYMLLLSSVGASVRPINMGCVMGSPLSSQCAVTHHTQYTSTCSV